MQGLIAPWALLLSVIALAAAGSGAAAESAPNSPETQANEAPPGSDPADESDPSESNESSIQDRLDAAMSRRMAEAMERLSKSPESPSPALPNCPPSNSCEAPFEPDPATMKPPEHPIPRWGQATVELEDGRVVTVLTIEGRMDMGDTAFGQSYLFAGSFEEGSPAIPEAISEERSETLADDSLPDLRELLAACLDPEDPIHFDCE